MKRMLSLMLAALMLLSLAACGAGAPSGDKAGSERLKVKYCGRSVKTLSYDLNKEYDTDELTLTAVAEQEDIETEIEWTSSDSSVVEIKDNGDGSCLLTLLEEGSAVLTASCGELEARVDVDCSRKTEAGDLQVERRYTVETGENGSDANFTPNEVIASGALSAGEKEYAVFKGLVQEMLTGSSNAEFKLADCTVRYELEDSLFRSITTVTADYGREIKYSFLYDGRYIKAVSADFGDGNVSEISWSRGDDGKLCMGITGYGEDNDITESDSVNVYVDGKRDGFRVSLSGDNVNINVGGDSPYTATVLIKLTAEDDVTGDGCLRVISLSIISMKDALRYDYESNEKESFVPYLAQMVADCFLNDIECKVIWCRYLEAYPRLDKVFLTVKSTHSGAVSYYFYSGDYIRGTVYSTRYSTVSVDADGNIADDR